MRRGVLVSRPPPRGSGGGGGGVGGGGGSFGEGGANIRTTELSSHGLLVLIHEGVAAVLLVVIVVAVDRPSGPCARRRHPHAVAPPRTSASLRTCSGGSGSGDSYCFFYDCEEDQLYFRNVPCGCDWCDDLEFADCENQEYVSAWTMCRFKEGEDDTDEEGDDDDTSAANARLQERMMLEIQERTDLEVETLVKGQYVAVLGPSDDKKYKFYIMKLLGGPLNPRQRRGAEGREWRGDPNL
mmetsp:Transcript_21401/g.52881  ORF Transcript_21401/g.52881 Transcript_21401/m.52881 type:complete len:240 (-) Transcript_21401:288-1007(-)